MGSQELKLEPSLNMTKQVMFEENMRQRSNQFYSCMLLSNSTPQESSAHSLTFPRTVTLK